VDGEKLHESSPRPARRGEDQGEGRTLLEAWTRKARLLKREAYAVYYACRDPRVPWYGRLLAACVVGYAFSPIDLIPDPVPILGYLDDLVLIPLGVALVLRTIPPAVMAECRDRADALMAKGKPRNWVAAAIVLLIWLVLAVLAVRLMLAWLAG
jgi:uncharacterized membrane protein YkvA (DUF1232 family)